ncbi:MAG: heparinase II/III family protein [Verrucomicrobiae bacterium]|nr:heparinase II/III family protein [Verrucomicrobiae bacterium]
MNNKLRWYWKRFWAMSPDEWARRAAFELQKCLWRHQPPRGAKPLHLDLPPDKTTSKCLPTPQPDKVALLARAEEILQRGTPDWQLDETTGKSAPLRFSLDIDYRDAASIGDAKVIWEKNRHHHLTVLAAAYALTRDERYADAAVTQLLDWAERNPCLRGLAWSHALEAAIRLIAWVWCERLLRGSPHHARLSALWPVIHQHQQFVECARSFGSSANNHLIGEMAGLFIAATAWPIFAESARWQQIALRSLEEEIIRQTFPCGLNREMAWSYHVFTFELFLLAWLENPSAFSARYLERLRRMAGVITALADCAPNFGDCDDARALDIGVSNARLRQLCGETPTSTDEAGLFVLRDGPVAVLFDAAPHGYLSIAAHAHADALAFTLTVDGQPVFVDSGTFDYFRWPEDRRYFRSTRAHNTVVVDGLDQSVQAGPFLWSSKAKTTVEAWDDTTAVASHDGYARIGVLHRRSVTLRGKVLEIADSLLGSGEHDVTILFHLAPECEFDGQVRRGNIRVRMTLPAAPELISGWYSSRFGAKKKTTTVQVRWKGKLPVTLTSRLEVLP